MSTKRLILVLVIWLIMLIALAHAATVQLTWDAPVWPAGQTPLPLVSYVLERDGTEVARPLAPPYSDAVEPGTYTYTVRALYAGNQLSDPSNAVTATVAAPPPVPVPTNFACVFIPGTLPTFTCQAAVVSGPPAGPYPLRPIGTITAQADSAETLGQSGGPAALAVDGQLATFWHTQYVNAAPPLPHTLTLDLGAVLWCDGLRYVPRQDGNHNGNLTSYRVETTTDLVTWSVAASGTWMEDSAEKTVRFPATKARYVRLVGVLSNGTPYASAAEVGIFAAPVP